MKINSCNYSGQNKCGMFLSSFLQKSGKNVPLLRTAQFAKNIIYLLITMNFIHRKKLIAPTGLRTEYLQIFY